MISVNLKVISTDEISLFPPDFKMLKLILTHERTPISIIKRVTPAVTLRPISNNQC